MNSSSRGDIYSITFAIIICSIIALEPFLILTLFCQHSRMGTLESDDFSKLYGTLTSNLKSYSWKRLAFPLIIWMRSFALVMILFADNGTA